MFVWVMVMYGLWQGCDVSISRRKESATTLETLTGQARSGKLKMFLPPSSWLVMLCHTMMVDLRSGIICFVRVMDGDKLSPLASQGIFDPIRSSPPDQLNHQYAAVSWYYAAA